MPRSLRAHRAATRTSSIDGSRASFLDPRRTSRPNLYRDELIKAAQQLGGHKTKRDAVTRALEEYARWLRQKGIVSEFGTIDYDPKFDDKKQRRVR